MSSETITVTIAPELTQTRLLVVSGERDLVKAVLPPSYGAHPRAAATLLEGLSLWHQQRLSVVLYVDEPERSSCALSLCDALGNGERNVHYEVGVAVREARRPGAARRIAGVGDFRDLRQLRLGGGSW
jgi:hypothetical protein